MKRTVAISNEAAALLDDFETGADLRMSAERRHQWFLDVERVLVPLRLARIAKREIAGGTWTHVSLTRAGERACRPKKHRCKDCRKWTDAGPCNGCGIIVCQVCAEREGMFCCDGEPVSEATAPDGAVVVTGLVAGQDAAAPASLTSAGAVASEIRNSVAAPMGEDSK